MNGMSIATMDVHVSVFSTVSYELLTSSRQRTARMRMHARITAATEYPRTRRTSPPHEGTVDSRTCSSCSRFASAFRASRSCSCSACVGWGTGIRCGC